VSETPTRTLELDPSLAVALPLEGHSRQWRQRLLSASLLLDLGPVREDEDPATQTLRMVARLFRRLEPLEDSAAQLEMPNPFNTGVVPPRVLWLMFGVWVLLTATTSALVASFGIFVAFTPPALLGLALIGYHELARKQARLKVQAQLTGVRGELAELVTEVLSHDFVVRTPDSVVVCLPSAVWLRHRKVEVERAAYVKENDPQLLELAEELGRQARGLEARAQEVALSGQRYEDSGLTPDLDEWAARLADHGVSVKQSPELHALLLAREP
jgi:hypothetical protein